MGFFTEQGISEINEVKEFPKVYQYYDPYVGCSLIPDNIYESDEELRTQVKLLLQKEHTTYSKDNKTIEENWSLEMIQGYDDDRPELENNAWFYSLRKVESWG